MLKRLKGPPGIASFAALKHFKQLVAEREKELILSAVRGDGGGWISRSSLGRRGRRCSSAGSG